MQDKSRISGQRVAIDNEKAKAFFNSRPKKDLPHRYNYVIYQDANPELALERDRYEKNMIQKYLCLDADSRILDIGCGVGRWADEVVKHFSDSSANGMYVGVDFSENLLEVARENFRENKQIRFLCGAFQNVRSVLEENHCLERYQRLLINGVLVYINDGDIDACLDGVDEYLSDDGGVIYIKEPVGVHERFTLNNFYSEELSSEYSAIYRSLTEYTKLFTKYFFDKGYTLVACSPTWPKDLENRKETMNYYWILRK